MRFACVARNPTVKNNPIPSLPATGSSLSHSCITLRLPCRPMRHLAWEFEENGREIKVRVDGQLCLQPHLNSLLCGGRRSRPGYLPEDIAPAIYRQGAASSVLENGAHTGRHNSIIQVGRHPPRPLSRLGEALLLRTPPMMRWAPGARHGLVLTSAMQRKGSMRLRLVRQQATLRLSTEKSCPISGSLQQPMPPRHLPGQGE